MAGHRFCYNVELYLLRENKLNSKWVLEAKTIHFLEGM